MTARTTALAVLLAAIAAMGEARAADMPANGPGAAIQFPPRCEYGTYAVVIGDTCAKVYTRVYCGKSALFTKYNGYTCNQLDLPGKILCKPRVVAGKCY